MKQIIHLCDSAFVGGPEKQILGLCLNADRSEFEPIVASFTPHGIPKSDVLATACGAGISTDAIPDGKLAFPLAILRLREMVRKYDASMVVAHGFRATYTAACAAVPFISYFHGRTGASTRVRAYEAMEVHAMRRAMRVVAVCKYAAKMLENLGVDNVIEIPNAVDADEIASCGDRESARRELGILPNERVVGCVGRLSVEKGHAYLIEAASDILPEFPNTRFVLIGDGPMRADLENRAHFLRISDRVIFAGHRANSTALMKAFDIFVLPSLTENMPVSLLEAMACGIYPIATDVGGVREVLESTQIDPITSKSLFAISDAVCDYFLAPQAHINNLLRERAKEFRFERQKRLFERVLEAALQ